MSYSISPPSGTDLKFNSQGICWLVSRSAQDRDELFELFRTDSVSCPPVRTLRLGTWEEISAYLDEHSISFSEQESLLDLYWKQSLHALDAARRDKALLVAEFFGTGQLLEEVSASPGYLLAVVLNLPEGVSGS